MKKYELIENNGGVKVLVTFDENGAADYVCGYETVSDDIVMADVEKIRSGADPVADGWEHGSLEYNVEPEVVYAELEEMLADRTAAVIQSDASKWYAVQESSEDEWGYGSYNYDKAVQMLHEQGHGLIAVIENGEECVEEIKYEDLF